MKTVGLVVEYNPLHNGHLYHIRKAKRVTGADAAVIVMSGNFLQRGEPALVSKWARAKMALSLGVDLVIELPLPFAVATAELFALGAVSLLDRLQVIDTLCFGSESGDIVWLEHLAQALTEEPERFRHSLKQGLNAGLSYPAAYSAAARQLLANTSTVSENALAEPNNILGLNYLLARNRLNSPIQAVTIKRQKAGYHQETITDERIASATAIRKLIFGERAGLAELSAYLPAATVQVLQEEFDAGRGPMNWERFRHPLFHRLLQQSPAELALYHEMGEGIEHRFKQAVKEATSIRHLVTLVKNKRYTWNRLQRMLLSVLLDLKKDDVASMKLHDGAPYARILGFSPTGQALLNEAKKKAKIPLVTKVTDGQHPMLDVEIAASAVYRLAQPEPGEHPFREEYLGRPLVWAEATPDRPPHHPGF